MGGEGGRYKAVDRDGGRVGLKGNVLGGGIIRKGVVYGGGRAGGQIGKGYCREA